MKTQRKKLTEKDLKKQIEKRFNVKYFNRVLKHLTKIYGENTLNLSLNNLRIAFPKLTYKDNARLIYHLNHRICWKCSRCSSSCAGYVFSIKTNIAQAREKMGKR